MAAFIEPSKEVNKRLWGSILLFVGLFAIMMGIWYVKTIQHQKKLSKEGWQRLEKGMTTAEVEHILGEPRAILQTKSGMVYHYDCSACKVEFDADSEELLQWSAPSEIGEE